ncbi:hypothetical protein [Crossiella sp. S99.2]|uniref:hypothetical protein n=1 Tax=Crossiella sp. S99.2 TaxID=2936272 RepID=UPI001FFE76D1|nr:hypothetical protein [Crossiella sp. S99.2]MCK2238067.1 hypothetical protein [Crossiella sp. S99.2]
MTTTPTPNNPLAATPAVLAAIGAERAAIAERVRAAGDGATALMQALRCNGTNARRLLAS